MNIVDLSFPIAGSSVSRDHGYSLYGALSEAIPALHEAEWLGVHPLGGRPDGSRLVLTDASRLRLRLPAERIPTVLPIAGTTLHLGKKALEVGAPQVHPLQTRATLDARLVFIRLTRSQLPSDEPMAESGFAKRFVAEARRQLEHLGIEGHLTLHGKRRITVAERRLLGFTVRVDGLSADASLRLQIHGLGGKRRMGCGIFRPTRGNSTLPHPQVTAKEERT